MDMKLLLSVTAIIIISLIVIGSATHVNTPSEERYWFVQRQGMFALINAGVAIFLMNFDYKMLQRYGQKMYIFNLVMLLAVMFVGQSALGAQRWIQLGPISFQPSEIAKLAVIIFLAMLIEKTSKQLGKFSSLVKVIAIMIPLLGVIAYSNLSTAVIIFGIIVCMLFVASPKYMQFIGVGVAGVAFIVVFIVTASYRGGRVEAWLHPETAGDAGYQTLQGLYAIGSGGLFGKGLGESLQKMGNVPESQNDMIFTIICEELGLFGAVCVILLFLLMIWRMMVIANNAQDLFGALLVVGVMSHIAIQVILNIAVVTNTIPNTGVILPFISYGGTSLIFLMAEMGLVLSVSKGIRLERIE